MPSGVSCANASRSVPPSSTASTATPPCCAPCTRSSKAESRGGAAPSGAPRHLLQQVQCRCLFASPSPLAGEYIPGVLGVKQQPPREGWSRREPRRKGGGGEGNRGGCQ